MSSGGESLSYFPLSFKETLHLGIKQGWPVNVKNCVVASFNYPESGHPFTSKTHCVLKSFTKPTDCRAGGDTWRVPTALPLDLHRTASRPRLSNLYALRKVPSEVVIKS